MTHPNSLWAATANPVTPTAVADQSADLQVAIVGGGFTGLRAALTLAEAGCDVAVFEAGEIGWGASGRNGGQVNPIGHETPAQISRRWNCQYGGDYAERFVDMTIASADEVFALVKRYQIDCDAEQKGWIRAVHGAAALPEFENMLAGWQAAGASLRPLEHPELQRLSGSASYRFGWLAANAGTVHPLSYVRGLADAAIAAGVRVFSNSPIGKLYRDGRRWRLMINAVTVNADQVILGTNAYSDQLVPGLRESIVPVVSIQGATKPLTAQQDAQILPLRHSFADTRRVIFYFRKTADNRLIFGSAGSAGESPGDVDRKRILRGINRIYPQFPELELDYIWGGHIAVTPDQLPHIHQPAPGLHIGLGCNGRGVAMATVMGRLLAETALGKPVGELPIPVCPIKKYPLHRYHKIGIKVALAWKEMRDRIEARTNSN